MWRCGVNLLSVVPCPVQPRPEPHRATRVGGECVPAEGRGMQVDRPDRRHRPPRTCFSVLPAFTLSPRGSAASRGVSPCECPNGNDHCEIPRLAALARNDNAEHVRVRRPAALRGAVVPLKWFGLAVRRVLMADELAQQSGRPAGDRPPEFRQPPAAMLISACARREPPARRGPPAPSSPVRGRTASERGPGWQDPTTG